MTRFGPAVVHLVEDLGMGGMERVVRTFASGLQKRGWDARVVCTRAGGAVADLMARDGLPVEVLESGGGWSSLGRLTRLLRRSKPFILHTHGSARAVGRVAGRLAGAAAVVHHFHGTEACGVRQRFFERMLPPDMYLACSDAVRRHFAVRLAARPGGMRVLFNPVPAADFRFDDASREEGRGKLEAGARPVVLCVGSFRPEKGQAVLIDAVPAVLSAVPDALFVFLGDGPLRGEMERKASPHGKSAVFLGIQRDPVPFLNACDVYAQPSVGREGLGVALLEAMACGRAVVASDLEGLPEAVGDAGLLAPPGDARALAGAVAGLLKDPGKRGELGLKARERVERLFSADVILNEVEEVYRGLLGA